MELIKSNPNDSKISRFDSLIIDEGNGEQYLTFNILVSMNYIYNNITRIPFDHNKRQLMFKHNKMYRLDRREMAQTIRMVMGKSNVCFTKDPTMENKILKMLEEESGIKMPQVFDLFELLQHLKSPYTLETFNRFIKEKQETEL
ncbi:hypothetical protein ABK040_011047 [Willaertia magna]